MIIHTHINIYIYPPACFAPEGAAGNGCLHRLQYPEDVSYVERERQRDENTNTHTHIYIYRYIYVYIYIYIYIYIRLRVSRRKGQQQRMSSPATIPGRRELCLEREIDR